MKRIAKALAALALMWAAPAAAQVVKVDGGAVRGKAFDGGGTLFRGIPFAAPPVENLRWKPPQPVLPWKGVRDSLDQPPSCDQAPALVSVSPKEAKMSRINEPQRRCRARWWPA